MKSNANEISYGADGGIVAAVTLGEHRPRAGEASQLV